ncbi:hypothetical protein ACVW1B_003682 [Bradyrhizobium sp. USDA 4502]
MRKREVDDAITQRTEAFGCAHDGNRNGDIRPTLCEGSQRVGQKAIIGRRCDATDGEPSAFAPRGCYGPLLGVFELPEQGQHT